MKAADIDFDSAAFKQKYGPWALVTGASSGIGAEFCRQLAAKGLHLIMVARRREKMEQLAEEIKENNSIQIVIVPVDLSKNEFLTALLPEIASLEIGLLVNNAGFGISGTFLNNNLERELELLNVNCRAPLVLTHVLGRLMIERKKGGIIFLSSVLGFMSAPFFASYAASKAFNLYMGEALWHELKKHGVDVESLSPGLTDTEFGIVSGAWEYGGMPVEPVVKASLKHLGNKPSVVTGTHNRLAVLLFKLSPRRYIRSLLIVFMRKRRQLLKRLSKRRVKM